MSKHLTAFEPLKAKYSNLYINALHETLELAEKLPDSHARQAQSEINYNQLIAAHAECCLLWQTLKRYIKSTYKNEALKTQLVAAGIHYYKKTLAKNWDSVIALLHNSKIFLNNHASELSANQNMPSTFPAAFNLAHTNFSKQLLIYQQAEKNFKTATANKLNANNSIFMLITEICQDGQLLFKSDQNIKNQFVFNTVLKSVSNTLKNKELNVVAVPHKAYPSNLEKDSLSLASHQ